MCSTARRSRSPISPRVLAGQPQFPELAAGEMVTTGTITDAWPVTKGETWSSDYGTLRLPGMTLDFV
jgi:2-keto-4-pentenoate hydratase